MKARLTLLLTLILTATNVVAQVTYNQIDESGNITQHSENNNFNKHNNDTTRNKEIPKGLYVWTIDRKFGDVIPAIPDTLPHLFMNTTFNNGMYGEYNTTGSNYTSRLSRIFINRPATPDHFIFTQPYSFTEKRPEIPAVNSGSYVRQPVQVPGATVNRREISVPGFLKK